jgi:hypothetical protein
MFIHQRLLAIQSDEQKKSLSRTSSPIETIPEPSNAEMPSLADRPRLKDYLAVMKPDTWGPTAHNRSSTKTDSTVRCMPSSMSTLIGNTHLYNQPAVPLSSLNMVQTVLPSHTNLHHQYYQVPSVNVISQSANSLVMSHALPYTSTNYTSLNGNEPNFVSQSHVSYSSNPNMNSYCQTPLYPSYPTQPVNYQSVLMPVSASTSSQSMHSSTNTYRSIQRSIPTGISFDPYRPQPVGAYDIPTAPMINAFDVYRPAGLQYMSQISPHPLSMHSHVYEQNQYVPTCSLANLSINPMLNQ